MNLQFQGKYIITGKIICETGLHIGGTQEGIEIGGVDNIVIRDPLTDLPYIPGSSLKGKLRHLLEWELNKVFSDGKDKYPAHSCENHPEVVKLKEEVKNLQGEEKKKKEQEIEDKIKNLINECEICLIFGSSAAITGGTPTRLIVRDSFPTGYEDIENPPENSTIWKWKKWLGENIYTELKTENVIDRVTSEANPRTMERVPADSEFSFEMIFDIYRNEDKKLLKNLFAAMHLLENSALGGSGTRGYGKIRFEVEKQEFRSVEYYKTGINPNEEEIVASLKGIKSIKEIIEKFPKIEP
jgi:CRISPR-associated protein Csm3